jgi:hypothetical protein
MRRIPLLLLIAAGAACARPAGLFVGSNALAHIGMLSGTIGSRPVGSAANLRAREYLVDQLRQIGFEVRVQEIDARRHELGITARVANIIGILPGTRTEAVALVAHYDSSPHAPGATDDALGVGVALEASRVFAARGKPQWSLFVLLTDGEESGLMGAAGLVTDREVMTRLHAYVNLESIGSGGRSVLFETGPGNAWLVRPWARQAPHPRGGSYGLEIYQRLPNDTDFSILKTRDVPGLNFAAVGDSYAYHTARDTPDRLSRDLVQTTGENTVAILEALQDLDIARRTADAATFFDLGGTTAVSYGPAVQWLISVSALLLGALAWFRLTTLTLREQGAFRWTLTFVWGWLGAAAACGAMVAATWLLRLAREVYHPWYARPGRLFLLMILVAAAIAWSVARVGQWLPARAHPVRHPSLTWTVTLPAWILVAVLALWFAPSAGYLFTLPLLSAGLLLSPIPARNDGWIRIASLVVLAVAATLWLRETHDLLRFVVAVMGRLAIITPPYVYAAVMTVAGMMVVPPMIAALGSARPLFRPWLVTAALLFGVAFATGAAYVAPAYTYEQPLRRHVRALQDADSPHAVWEVASLEPGLDLAEGAPDGWMPVADAPPGTTGPWGRYRMPFVFRTQGPSLGPAPVRVTAFALRPLPQGVQLSVSLVPSEPGVTVAFVLPPGLTPARTSLPGVEQRGRWAASYVAVRPDGLAWEASFRGDVASQLRQTRITVTVNGLPGGEGWQRLPRWLPQDTVVWTAAASWSIPAELPPSIAPVPPLR